MGFCKKIQDGPVKEVWFVFEEHFCHEFFSPGATHGGVVGFLVNESVGFAAGGAEIYERAGAAGLQIDGPRCFVPAVGDGFYAFRDMSEVPHKPEAREHLPVAPHAEVFSFVAGTAGFSAGDGC